MDDEPACKPHGARFMWDGGTDAECVACLRSKLESMTADRDQARKTSAWNKDNHLAAEAEIVRLKAELDGARDAYDGTCRVAGSLLEELKVIKLQNEELLKLFSEVADIFELRTRTDIDGLLRGRIQEALTLKREDPVLRNGVYHCDLTYCRYATERRCICLCMKCAEAKRADH